MNDIRRLYILPILLCLATAYVNSANAQCNAVITSNLDPAIEGCDPLTVQFNSSTSSGVITGIIWDFGDGDSATSNNPSHTFLAGAGDTTYTVTLNISCVSGSSSYTVSVTVFAPPGVDFIVDTTSVCALSDSVCFINFSDTGVGSSYSWNFGDFTTSASFEPCHTYTTPGLKDVNLQVTNNNGCLRDTTYMALINVIAAPNPQFSANTVVGCNPQDVVFANTTIDTASISLWVWNWDDGTPNDSLLNPGMHTFTNADTFIVILSATNLLGCSNSSQSALVILETPTADFTADSIVCANENIVITYTGSALPSATYTWDFDGGTANPGTGQGPQFVSWDTSGIKVVVLTVTVDSCSSTFLSNVLVNPLPAIGISSSAVNDSSCSGQIVTFVANPGGYPNYSFYVNGIVVQDSSYNVLESSTLNNGDLVTVEVTDMNGCTSDTSSTVNIAMTINPLPLVNVSSSVPNDSICEGDTVTFTVAPDSLDDYSFYIGFLLLQSAASNTYTSNILQNGDSIFVIATDSLGCSSIASNPIITTVVQPLEAPQVNCGNSSLAPDSIQFTWDTVPGAIGYEISIDTGNTFITPSSGFLGLYHWVVGVDSLQVIVRALGDVPCGDSPLSIPVTCYALPCNAITFQKGSDPTVCSGDTAKLAISNISASPYSVLWNGDTLTISTDTVFTFIADTDTVIAVMVIDSSQLFCPFPTKYFIVTVKPLPTSLLTSSLDSICEGTEVIFTASPAGFENYEFFNDTIFLHDSAYHIYSLASLAQGDSIYVVTTENGCTDTSNIIGITVIPPPVITLSSSAPNDTICAGDSIIFTVDSIGLAQYLFYSVNLLQDSIINFYSSDSLQDGDFIFALATDSFGCASDTSNYIITTVLSITNVSLTGSDSTICAGDSISFIAAPLGLVNYLFYNDTLLLQDSSINIYTTDSLQSGDSIIVIAINSNGCASVPLDTIGVLIKPIPDPVISSSDSLLKICNGDTAYLLVSIDSVFDGAIYLWNTGDTIDSIAISPANDAIYYVLTSFNACTGADSINIIVDTLGPTANAGPNIVICLEEESTQLNAAGGDTYSWFPTAGLSDPNIADPVASPDETTTYTVTVTNIACSDIDSVTVIDLCITIPEVITPNEDNSNDQLIIPGIEFFPDNNIVIFNRWGNEVFYTTGYNNENNYWAGKSSKGKPLPDGTYFYILDLGIDIEPFTGFVMIHR